MRCPGGWLWQWAKPLWAEHPSADLPSPKEPSGTGASQRCSPCLAPQTLLCQAACGSQPCKEHQARLIPVSSWGCFSIVTANNGDPGRSCVSAPISAALRMRLRRGFNSCELAEPPRHCWPQSIPTAGGDRQDVAGDMLPGQGPLPLRFHSVKKLRKLARHRASSWTRGRPGRRRVLQGPTSSGSLCPASSLPTPRASPEHPASLPPSSHK